MLWHLLYITFIWKWNYSFTFWNLKSKKVKNKQTNKQKTDSQNNSIFFFWPMNNADKAGNVSGAESRTLLIMIKNKTKQNKTAKITI